MKNILILVLFISFLWTTGCKKLNEGDIEPYKGKSYFPVNVGHELIYNVEELTRNQTTGTWDTTHYLVKEIITGTFTDSAGRETQKIERYIKNDTFLSFTLYKTYSGNLLTSTAHRVEDNIRYIKLYFPQYLDKNWDSNGQNSLGGQYCKYIYLHQPLTQAGLSFDSTCAVLQLIDSTTAKSKYYLEKYAAKVGMIYKINQELHYDLNGTMTTGSIYKETLVSYKN